MGWTSTGDQNFLEVEGDSVGPLASDPDDRNEKGNVSRYAILTRRLRQRPCGLGRLLRACPKTRGRPGALSASTARNMRNIKSGRNGPKTIKMVGPIQTQNLILMTIMLKKYSPVAEILGNLVPEKIAILQDRLIILTLRTHSLRVP